MEQRLQDIARIFDVPIVLDPRVLRGLSDLPEDKVMKLLDDFEGNMTQNKQGIRNPAAYLMGMASRVRKSSVLPTTGVVLRELEHLFRTGHIYREDIDERCVDMLKQLPEDLGLKALAELRNADPATVKNMSAFFMSVMKKYTQGSGGGKGGGGSSHYDNRGSAGSVGGSRHFDSRGGSGWGDESYTKYQSPRHDADRGRGGAGPPPHAHERHQYDHHSRQYQPVTERPVGDSRAHRTDAEGDFGDSFPAAPRVIPSELLFGFGDDEYAPTMPRLLEGANLYPSVQDGLENLIETGILEIEDLNSRIMNELRQLPEHVCLRVVKGFGTLDRHRGNLRSITGFLMSVIKKTISPPSLAGEPRPYSDSGVKRKMPIEEDYYSAGSMQRQRYGGKGGPVDRHYENDLPGRERNVPAGASMVDDEMRRLVSQGLLRHEDVDERVREFLAVQDAWIVSKALTDFAAKDMSRINNKSNFLKGIVRKLRENAGDPQRGGPPSQHHSSGDRGGSMFPHSHSPPTSHYTQQQHYVSSERGPGPDSMYHSGRGKGGGRGGGKGSYSVQERNRGGRGY